jgi:hypothetical protein
MDHLTASIFVLIFVFFIFVANLGFYIEETTDGGSFVTLLQSICKWSIWTFGTTNTHLSPLFAFGTNVFLFVVFLIIFIVLFVVIFTFGIFSLHLFIIFSGLAFAPAGVGLRFPGLAVILVLVKVVHWVVLIVCHGGGTEQGELGTGCTSSSMMLVFIKCRNPNLTAQLLNIWLAVTTHVNKLDLHQLAIVLHP